MPSCLHSLRPDQRYFLQLFVSVLVSIGNGAIFCFGIFSPFMKEQSFMLDQTQVNIVSTTGAVLSYFSLPTGYLYDRYGPRVTLLCGAALNFIGWMGMFAIFKDMEDPLLGRSTAVISFFFGLSQWSASFYETGSVLTNLEAFSLHRGKVIIIQKTFMGLGSSIIAQVYVAFFRGSFPISTFFLFLAVTNSLLGVLGSLAIKLPTAETTVVGLNCKASGGCYPPPSDGGVRKFTKPLNFGVLLLIVNVIFVATVTILQAYIPSMDLTVWKLLIGGTTVVLVLLFAVMVGLTPPAHDVLPAVIPEAEESCSHDVQPSSTSHKDVPSCNAEKEKGCTLRSTTRVAPGYSSVSSREDKETIVDAISSDSECDEGVMPLNNNSLQENIRTIDMWLLWMVSFAVWGTGTVVSSNSTQIYQALDFAGYTSSLDTVYVSIYGVASAVGRIFVGFADEALRRRRLHVSRLFPVAPIVNTIGIPLFFLLPPKGLIVAFFLSGLATGITWGSTVLIIKSLFAPMNCGKHYNVLYTAGMLTPIVFNVAMFGPLYDHASDVQGRAATHTCCGSICVRVPLLTSLALNMVAIPLAVGFARRVIANRGLH